MIIEANGQYYLTTQHADEKILDLDLSNYDVGRVIAEGEHGFTSNGDDIYRLTLRGQRIAVIVVDDERIRTVFII